MAGIIWNEKSGSFVPSGYADMENNEIIRVTAEQQVARKVAEDAQKAQRKLYEAEQTRRNIEQWPDVCGSFWSPMATCDLEACKSDPVLIAYATYYGYECDSFYWHDCSSLWSSDRDTLKETEALGWARVPLPKGVD